jgi:hypothetical protein
LLIWVAYSDCAPNPFFNKLAKYGSTLVDFHFVPGPGGCTGLRHRVFNFAMSAWILLLTAILSPALSPPTKKAPTRPFIFKPIQKLKDYSALPVALRRHPLFTQPARWGTTVALAKGNSFDRAR